MEKVENSSFLSTSTLEKPELTYAYLLKLSSMMNSIGLDYETLPLNFLSRYLAKYVLKNEDYWLLEQLRLKQILSRSRHPAEETVAIDFKGFGISEEEVREELIRAENQRSNAG